MGIIGGAMVPHPPLIIPEIGKGREQEITNTIKAYNEVAKKIKELKPDTIIVLSPHGECFSDAFRLYCGQNTTGNFSMFGAPEVSFYENYDQEFINELKEAADKENFQIVTLTGKEELDHGVMVPLFFINPEYHDYKLVRISLSGFCTAKHYETGLLIKEVASKLNKNYYVIASGDLSHKLTEDGPYGFNINGPEYDKKIMNDMENANFLNLLNYDYNFLEQASTCGHKGFSMMAGTFDSLEVSAKRLSYEGPFGVGYGICTYEVTGENKNNNYLDKWKKAKRKEHENEDEYITLARKTIEEYIKNNKKITIDNVSEELLNNKAGVFVSIHEEGVLRGCIGTIIATKNSIAEEIIDNAISASTSDPRFIGITKDELDYLDISVDVLGKIEKISSPKELDVKKYGVIVSTTTKRGLLLPNIDGITTIEEQIKIALRKGNINSDEKYSLERFEVIRHE